MAFGDDQQQLSSATVESTRAPATGFVADTKHAAAEAVCTVGNIALKTTELMSNAVSATIHAAATVVTTTGGVVVHAVEVVGIHPTFSAVDGASPRAEDPVSQFERVQASEKHLTNDTSRVTSRAAPAGTAPTGRVSKAGTGYGETAALDDPKMCGGYGSHESAPVTDTDIAANAERASAKAAMDRRILEASPTAKPFRAVAIGDAAHQLQAEELGKRDAAAAAASTSMTNGEAQSAEPVVTLEEFEKEREDNMVDMETKERTKVDPKGLKQLKQLKKLTEPSDTLIEVPKDAN